MAPIVPVFKSPGGHVQPKGPPKTTKPKGQKTGRRTVSVKPMVDPSYDDAFNLFRHTVQTLKQYTPGVNTALISQPYTDAQAAATSMSQGLNRDTLASGATALQNYNDIVGKTVDAGQQFGNALGAPVHQGVQDRGSALIGQETNTNAQAALDAGPAYNQLLERAKAGALAKAQLGHDDLISQGIASSALQIPGNTQSNRQRTFQEDTADKNYLLALGAQKDKRAEAYRQDLLRSIQLRQTGDYQSGLLDQGQQRIDQGAARLAAQTKLWNAQVKKANAIGKQFKLNAIPQVLAALKPVSTAGGTTQQGYNIQYQASDEDGKYGPLLTAKGVAKDWTPGPGNEVISVNPNNVTTPGKAGSFSWARYKHARGILTTNNPGITPQQIISILGPTPKTTKKKK